MVKNLKPRIRSHIIIRASISGNSQALLYNLFLVLFLASCTILVIDEIFLFPFKMHPPSYIFFSYGSIERNHEL